MIFPETPAFSWERDTAMTSFAANGVMASGSETAEFVISADTNEGTHFDNDKHESSLWWSAEFAARTDKDGSGYTQDWSSLHDPTEGTTVPLSYQKPIWEDNQSNSLPHMRSASDAFVLDTPIGVRSNQTWTIAFMSGPQTPSLYGCFLGSTNASSSSILTAYRWAGRRLKLRNDLGEELSIAYSSSVESGYGGGVSGIHILRCDGTKVYMRWNGQDLGDHTPTAGAQYNFDRFFHLKTTTTQQNSHCSIHEVVVFDEFVDGTDLTDLEGVFMSKYDVMDKVPSTHPFYSETAGDYYKTSKVDNSDDATTGSLTLSATQSSFVMKSTTLTADTRYSVTPLNIGSPSICTLKVQFT